MSEPLMTYDELSEALGVPKNTLYWWVHEKKIPHYRLNPRTVRFRLSEVLASFENVEGAPPPQKEAKQREPMTDYTVALAQLALAFGRTNRVTFHEDGETLESDTDHTVMLGLIACHVASCLQEPEGHFPHVRRYKTERVAEFALIHDIVEARCGDTNSFDMSPEARAKKAEREKLAYYELKEEFGATSWMMHTLHAYEQQEEPEARLVRYLDKALPKINHALNNCASIKAMGKTYDDLVRAHREQFERLSREYPEFTGTAVSRLMWDLMQMSEDAWEG